MFGIIRLFFALSFFVVILSCGSVINNHTDLQEQSYVGYQPSLSYLESNDSLFSIDGYKVSDQVIDFRNYYDLYAQYLPEISLRIEDIPLEFDQVKYKVSALRQLSNRKKTRNVVFFSNEVDNLFFVEIFEDYPAHTINYNDAPAFGKSKIYIFSYVPLEEEALTLIYSGLLNYN